MLIDDVQDLKLKFYQLMIELGHFENDYLVICRHYRAVYDTPCVKDDPEKRKEVLDLALIFCIFTM